jgi:hypothetical protein
VALHSPSPLTCGRHVSTRSRPWCRVSDVRPTVET